MASRTSSRPILVADQYEIRPMLEFLKNTKVRSRCSGVEGENEWEQGRDQKGEDQLKG